MIKVKFYFCYQLLLGAISLNKIIIFIVFKPELINYNITNLH